jgi:hypothetical protein
MVRVSRRLIPMVVALAMLTATASAVQAQYGCYPPAPVAVAPVTSYYAPPVTTYYAPAPVTAYYAPAPVVTSYYAAPAPVVTSYYAAPAVTTYRYGPLGRLRGVSSYYPAPVGVPSFGYYYP